MAKREIRSWLMDMDGVLVNEEQAIPGADEFLTRLRERGIPFMVLTNNSSTRGATSQRACVPAGSTCRRRRSSSGSRGRSD